MTPSMPAILFLRDSISASAVSSRSGKGESSITLFVRLSIFASHALGGRGVVGAFLDEKEEERWEREKEGEEDKREKN